jgi:hypothetical protein
MNGHLHYHLINVIFMKPVQTGLMGILTRSNQTGGDTILGKGKGYPIKSPHASEVPHANASEVPHANQGLQGYQGYQGYLFNPCQTGLMGILTKTGLMGILTGSYKTGGNDKASFKHSI